MCEATVRVPMRRKRHSVPSKYLPVVKFVLVFSATLTLLALLDRPSKTDEQPSHRFLSEEKMALREFRRKERKKVMAATKARAKKKKEAEKKEQESAVNVDKFEWSHTTKAFLPVLTKSAFKLYVDTFRSALFCFERNGLYLTPTGGTLVGTLRHKGMIPWDDDIDVYYFRKDKDAIFDPRGPVQTCLQSSGIETKYYRGLGGPSLKNISFKVNGKHMLSAFPVYYKEEYVDFVSSNIEERRSPMLNSDIFPMKKMPFHDYHVYLPHNIEKYLEVDWGKNQIDEIKTPTYESLMSTAISGHLHRGCKRAPMVANISDIGFLEYYDPEDFENTLPFQSDKCTGRVLKEYEEYYQVRRLVVLEGE